MMFSNISFHINTHSEWCLLWHSPSCFNLILGSMRHHNWVNLLGCQKCSHKELLNWSLEVQEETYTRLALWASSTRVQQHCILRSSRGNSLTCPWAVLGWGNIQIWLKNSGKRSVPLGIWMRLSGGGGRRERG